jgi:hypothetical protein
LKEKKELLLTSFPGIVGRANRLRDIRPDMGVGPLMNTLLCIVLPRCSIKLIEPRHKEEGYEVNPIVKRLVLQS